MARMRIDPVDRPRVKWECYRMAVGLQLPPRRLGRILEFVEAYLPLDAREAAEFRALVEASAPAVKEVVMEYSNQWIEKGLREGRQEGRQEGRAEATLTMLLRLLTRRFGVVPEARRNALAALPVERLEALIEGIFELDGLEDLDHHGA